MGQNQMQASPKSVRSAPILLACSLPAANGRHRDGKNKRNRQTLRHIKHIAPTHHAVCYCRAGLGLSRALCCCFARSALVCSPQDSRKSRERRVTRSLEILGSFPKETQKLLYSLEISLCSGPSYSVNRNLNESSGSMLIVVVMTHGPVTAHLTEVQGRKEHPAGWNRRAFVTGTTDA